MKSYKVVFSNDARQDLKSIVKYIKNELNEPKIANKISIKIKNGISEIAENPKIYTIIDYDFIKRLKLRKKVVNNYIIFYRILETKKEIQIVRILYGRRDWNKLF